MTLDAMVRDMSSAALSLSLYCERFIHIDRVCIESVDDKLSLHFERGPKHGMDTLHRVTRINMMVWEDTGSIQKGIEDAFKEADTSFKYLKEPERPPGWFLPPSFLRTSTEVPSEEVLTADRIRKAAMLMHPPLSMRTGKLMKIVDMGKLAKMMRTPLLPSPPMMAEEEVKEEDWDMKDCW